MSSISSGKPVKRRKPNGGGDIVFGTGALVAVGLYLVSMIGVGYYARGKRETNSMADFYLAGRSLGLLVLFLTLYATQYSGNTLFGAYR